jgi:hypothetical protein
MTESTNRPHVPGTTLAKIARLLFDEPLLSAAVHPTIADLQREVADAGASRVKRVRAQWRGYCAFWTLVLIAPFASLALPTPDARGVALPDAVARLGAGAIVLTLVIVLGPMVGAWVAGVTAAGALFAIVIHAWYLRHPSDIPAPVEPPKRLPQINFSSTEVAGNVGGLIFALGSVVIVAVGFPALIWFLFGSTVAACVLAWGLVAWHKSHPKRGLPENRIVLR